MPEITVGVDIGTTSVKALAVDADGSVVASARVPHAVLAASGQLAHDADAAWRRGVSDAYGRVAKGCEDAVQAVAVAAMVPSLTAVDGQGRPLGPGLLYGDARGDGKAGESPALSGEAAGFLRWLAAERPDAAGFWPAQAVANHALSGRAAIDFATAWCANPLFDGEGWDEPVVRGAGAAVAQLPEVVAGMGPIGRIGADGPLVGAGTVDALAAQIVAGADQPGDVLAILGATLITWVVRPGWVEVPGLWTVPHTVPGMCLVGGASNAGGLFVSWALGLLAEAEDADVASSDDVPVWLPYLRGERVPLHRGDLRSELSGLHVGHGAAELRRAAHEASGFALRHIIDLASAGTADPGPRRIVAVGGGVRSAPWVQALADCTHLPVEVAAVPDASALGTAFLARCTAGLEPEWAAGRRWARSASTTEPDASWAPACDDRYDRFLHRTTAALDAPGEREAPVPVS